MTCDDYGRVPHRYGNGTERSGKMLYGMVPMDFGDHSRSRKKFPTDRESGRG